MRSNESTAVSLLLYTKNLTLRKMLWKCGLRYFQARNCHRTYKAYCGPAGSREIVGKQSDRDLTVNISLRNTKDRA